MSAFNVYNDVSREQTSFNFFCSPSAIYRCVTENMKAIRIQSELKPSYFPMGSLGEDV